MNTTAFIGAVIRYDAIGAADKRGKCGDDDGHLSEGKMGRLTWLLSILSIIVAVVLAGLSPASAERRLALVVGNNTYTSLPADKQLSNALSDARAIRDTLQGLGFEVLYGENLDRRAMVDRLFDLTARLGKDDIALFYFAGHGVSFSGANYLLPSDIPPPRASGRAEEGRLAEQAISETTVIERLTASGARVSIVVLDACRNNPLQGSDSRSIGNARGLSQIQPAKGVFSIYSAGIGQEALDRLGRDDRNPNSVFTRVFIEKLRTPGLDLKAVATQTRSVVIEMTQIIGHDQFPAYYDQMTGGDVYLAGLPAAVTTAPTTTAPVVLPSDAERAWGVTKDTTSVAVLEEFIRQFGQTPYGSMAHARLEELRRVGGKSASPTNPFGTANLTPPGKPPSQRSAPKDKNTQAAARSYTCCMAGGPDPESVREVFRREYGARGEAVRRQKCREQSPKINFCR